MYHRSVGEPACGPHHLSARTSKGSATSVQMVPKRCLNGA